MAAYATRNDRYTGTRTYKDVDAAAIDWRAMRNDTIGRFMAEGNHGETLGDYITRTGAFY